MQAGGNRNAKNCPFVLVGSVIGALTYSTASLGAVSVRRIEPNPRATLCFKNLTLLHRRLLVRLVPVRGV